MARYAQRGRSRGTGQGRYNQLHGSGNGGLKATVMLFGALLIISVMSTVYAWIERGNAISDLNILVAENNKLKTDGIHKLRESHHLKTFMRAGGAPGCERCQELLTELSGKTKELANAYNMLTEKQKDDLHFTYDVVAKDIIVTRVAGTGADKEQIQISFTVKNQATEARGNMLGRFKLYMDGAMTWQKDFRPADLQPGATTYVQFMAPADVVWDLWGCQIYPSKTSESTGGTPRQ
jgi:hypothetical protein